jgi:hypothetical protein
MGAGCVYRVRSGSTQKQPELHLNTGSNPITRSYCHQVGTVFVAVPNGCCCGVVDKCGMAPPAGGERLEGCRDWAHQLPVRLGHVVEQRAETAARRGIRRTGLVGRVHLGGVRFSCLCARVRRAAALHAHHAQVRPERTRTAVGRQCGGDHVLTGDLHNLRWRQGVRAQCARRWGRIRVRASCDRDGAQRHGRSQPDDFQSPAHFWIVDHHRALRRIPECYHGNWR